MTKNYETRDEYNDRPTRRSAEEYAANPAIPQWLRNAWAAVASGEARSVESYFEARDARRARKRPTARPAKAPAPRPSNEAREKWLADHVLDPMDILHADKMRQLMKKRYDPLYFED
jgi:hypothetical protein